MPWRQKLSYGTYHQAPVFLDERYGSRMNMQLSPAPRLPIKVQDERGAVWLCYLHQESLRMVMGPAKNLMIIGNGTVY